jgi:phosphatidylglycerol lysyltransferase
MSDQSSNFGQGPSAAQIACPVPRQPLSVQGRAWLARLADLAGLVLTRFAGFRPRCAALGPFDVAAAKADGSTEAALALLERFSTLSGQMHALSDDPWQFLWAKGRCAFLPFHEMPSSLIAWRDPVGPAEAAPGLIEHFQAYAARRGKHAMLVGVSRSAVEAVAGRGFQPVWVGAEPFYDLASWNTRGKAGIKVRLACNHARRLGAAAREAHPLHDPGDRAAIAQVEEAWKSARSERRSDSFLRTAPLDGARHRRYFVVETPRRMESFLVCSPVSRRGQYMQDVVRMPDAPRGANELAMSTALGVFHGEGLDFVTGGITPFGDPSKPRSNEVAGPAGALGWVIRHFDGLYHFAGLQQFRAKFSPSRVVDIYALLWPGTLTPALAWDIRSLLS